MAVFLTVCFTNTYVISLIFHWVAIPWMQAEINKWMRFKNRTSTRADRNKLLPVGIPFLICPKPHQFGALDFKVLVIFSVILHHC